MVVAVVAVVMGDVTPPLSVCSPALSSGVTHHWVHQRYFLFGGGRGGASGEWQQLPAHIQSVVYGERVRWEMFITFVFQIYHVCIYCTFMTRLLHVYHTIVYHTFITGFTRVHCMLLHVYHTVTVRGKSKYTLLQFYMFIYQTYK